jgi:hypothetical protein
VNKTILTTTGGPLTHLRSEGQRNMSAAHAAGR